MNKELELAVEVTLGALLDYAKYLEDSGQLSYQLLKDRVETLTDWSPKALKEFVDVYVWFDANKKPDGVWHGVQTTVVLNADNRYYAKIDGEMVEVTKDSKDEFRQKSKGVENE